jgi:hypothetical protein
MMQFVPGFEKVLQPNTAVIVFGKQIKSYSFFKNNIIPEWEHHANEHGITLSTRLSLPQSEIRRLWTFMTCECARGSMNEHVFGIQFTKKNFKQKIYLKVDFWMSKNSDINHMCSELNTLGSHWGFDLKFCPRVI